MHSEFIRSRWYSYRPAVCSTFLSFHSHCRAQDASRWLPRGEVGSHAQATKCELRGVHAGHASPAVAPATHKSLLRDTDSLKSYDPYYY